MKSREELHAYWRNPDTENLPGKYLRADRKESSDFLVNMMLALDVERRHTILEIGCNAGRNLMYLWKGGYRRLMGIEINPEAVALMRKRITYLNGALIFVGPVEEIIKKIKAVDVIFTMAVLVHIHPESEFIFREMVKKARRYIVTIEDEKSNTIRHYARNYQEVFEGLGMEQVFYAPSVPGMHPAYCARAFERRTATQDEPVWREA